MPSGKPVAGRLTDALLDLAWGQWALLGLAGSRPTKGTHTAIDLEALLLLTFEIGRDDPRLFDEALDWMLTNPTLISTNRLRGLCVDDVDGQLAEAALDWLGRQGRGARRTRPRKTAPDEAGAEPVFPRDLNPPELDPDYLAHGLIRRPITPSGKSAAADLLAPAALTLRLRTLLGQGPRAEVVRTLLTIQAPRVDAAVLTAAAGYSARRTREAINDLVRTGMVREARLGGVRATYSIDVDAWAHLLWNDAPPPHHQDWPQLFAGCRVLVRGLRHIDEPETDYLRASAARTLWMSAEPQLRYAGVALPAQPFAPGEAYLPAFYDLLGAVQRHIAGLAD